MKKTITTLSLALVIIISSTAFVRSYNNGIAGFTGAPGETSCNTAGCHSGGSSAASGATITSSPIFTAGEFIPGATYTITVELAASGFNRYGFGCEILNAGNTNAGTMQNAGAGVKFLNSGARKNAVHTTPKLGTGGTTFTFEWTAPSIDDEATIYVAGNAVNNNQNSTGDFPIAPISMHLFATPEPVGISENKIAVLSNVLVYPNPAKELTTISYALSLSEHVTLQIVDMHGKIIKEVLNETQASGLHDQIIDLHDISPGIYFVKTLIKDQKVSQKLLAIR